MKKLFAFLLAFAFALALPAAVYADGWRDSLADWLGQYNAGEYPLPVSRFPASAAAPTAEPTAAPTAQPTEAPTATPAATVTVKYDCNGGYWFNAYASPAMTATKRITVTAGAAHTVLNAPIRTCYAFRGWRADDGTVYLAGATITPTCNMSLAAVWEYTA